MSPLRDDLVQALQSGPMTARQAAEAVKTSYQPALVALTTLCDIGKVRRHGWGASKRGGRPMLFELVA